MNNSKITIRHAELSDLPEIQTLFVDTISAICKDDYSPEQINVWAASIQNTKRWVHKLKSQHFIVAQLAEKIVGYASLENNDYLDFLYVHKDYQRKGIANKLYSNIEAEAITKGTTILNSDVSITAKPFFEKKGFRTLQTQKNKIRGVEIVNFKMTKQL